MTLSLPKVSRKNAIIFTTFLIIIGVFAYYFLVYVQGNENEIIDRAYRVLHRKALNIENKSKSYEKYLGNVYEEVSPELSALFEKNNERLKYLNGLINGYYNEMEAYDYVSDTARQALKSKKRLRVQIDRTYKQLDNLYQDMDLMIENVIKSKLESAAPENVRVDNFREGEIFYERKDYNYDNSSFVWEKNDPTRNSYVQFSQNSSSFLKDILKEGFYDQFLLLKAYDNYSNANLDYSVAYQSFQNPIDLASLEAIGANSGLLGLSNDTLGVVDDPRLVQPVRVSLYNTDYLVVFHQFKCGNQLYFLGGFLEVEKFRKEAQKVEIFVLVLAILSVLLLIIAMPLLKLVFMSSIERLYIKNVVMTGMSVILGVPIILLITFVVYTFIWRDAAQTARQLTRISTEISSAFEDEIGDMLYVLGEMDDYLNSTELDLDTTIVKHLDDSTYQYYNHAFWVNENGRPAIVKTPHSFSSNNISLRERTYVKKVLKDSLWTFRNDSGTYACFLESIISWSDFSKETAISMPSKLSDRGLPIAAITSQLGSLTHPILEPGYGFAIIDAEGEVQYHSDKERILQENFLEESNNPAKLIGGIHSRVDEFAHIRYRNVNHQVYVKPLNSLPLYLIVFYDKEYRNAKIQGVISISIILLLVSFGMVSLMIFILFILQQKRSKLKIKRFLFHWIKPSKEKSAEYLSLTVLFVIITLLMTLLIVFSEPLGIVEYDMLFLFVITNAYLFMVSYGWLSEGSHDERFQDRERNRFFAAFIFFLVVANVIFFHSVKSGGFLALFENWWLTLYQIILITIVFLSNRYHDFLELIRTKLKLANEVFEKHGYTSFLFVWLLVSSILPVFYIFRVAYNEEAKVWQKYDQLAIAESYHQKVRLLDNSINAIEDSLRQVNYYDTRLAAAKYADIDSIQHQLDTLPCNFNKTVADQIFAAIRPHYNKLIVRSKGFVYDGSHDCNYHWRYTEEKRPFTYSQEPEDSVVLDFINLHYRGSYDPQIRRTGNRTIIKSRMDELTFSIFSSFSGITFGLSILMVLCFVYVLIDYCVNKIYGLQYATFKNHLPLEIDNFKEVASDGKNSKQADRLHPYIILLGLPKSNKSQLLQSISGSNKLIDLLDMNNDKDWDAIMNASYKRTKGVIVENFEYGILSHDMNCKRRALLEKLITEEVNQLVISTNVHPRSINEYYESKAKDDPQNDFDLEIEVWRQLLGGFIVVHNPIKKNNLIDDELKGWVTTKKFKDLFKEELNKGTFLPTLLPAIKDYFVKLKKNVKNERYIDKEDVILRIQLLAESYYHGLWNTLSKEEKYVIYDLAADRFVNSNNTIGIRNLLEKGLLVYDQELKIMNESFTNFVLMAIKKSEALKMEKEVREKGTWNTISTVLVLVLVGVLAFLFLANPDFFHDLNALMSVFVGVVGLLTRFGSVLVSGKSFSGNGSG